MRQVIPAGAILVPKQAKRVFQGIIYDVYQWRQTMFDGSTRMFEMLKRPDTVKVIAVKNNALVMLKQQQPSQPTFYSLPGGRNEVETETELQAAQRELLEETGLRFANWTLLEVVQPHPKIEQFIYTFLATDELAGGEPRPDAGEKITVKLVSFEEALHMAQRKNNRFLPYDLLKNAGSIEGLKQLPPYSETRSEY